MPDNNINHLLKNPAKGGIPAIDKKVKVKVIDKTGLSLDSPPNSTKSPL